MFIYIGLRSRSDGQSGRKEELGAELKHFTGGNVPMHFPSNALLIYRCAD